MASYEVTGPDGKVYDVTGPKGATREQIIAKVKESLAPGNVGEFFQQLPIGAARGAIGEIASEGAAEAGMMGIEGVEGGPETEAKLTGKLPQPSTFGGRLGERLGRAATTPTTYMGPGGVALKAGGAVTSALGSEALRSAAQDTGLEDVADIAGGIAGGAAAGVPKLGQTGLKSIQAGRGLADEAGIKAASQAGYDVLQQNNIPISQPAANNLYGRLYLGLERDFYDPDYTAKKVYGLIDKATRRPDQNLALWVNLYEGLGHIKPSEGSEYAAAQAVRAEIRNTLDQAAPHLSPVFKKALGDWSAYKKIEEVRTAQESAERRAQKSGTGLNFQNTMRQEIDKILSNPKRLQGYTDAEREQMKSLIAGSTAENLARWGKTFSPESRLGAVGLLVESLYNAPVAIAAGAAGLASHKIGDFLTKQEVAKLVRLIQERAPENVLSGAAGASQAARQAVQGAKREMGAAVIRGGAESTQDVLNNPDNQPQL